MTALPTTVGETNTQPWVSNRHSASHGFAELAAGARSSARIGARLRSNKAATPTNDRLCIRPPCECSYCLPLWDGTVFEAVTSTGRSETWVRSDELGLRNDSIGSLASCGVLPCAEVHTERSEGRRILVLWRAAEHVGSPRHLDLVETAFSQERDQLCFQQSAGDSAGP